MLKDKNKLLNISELALRINLVNPKNNKPLIHTLRFWETKFKQLKPTTFVGGRRYYSHKNIEVVKMVIFLLKDQRLTINGAIKVMNDKSKKLDDIKTLSIRDKYYKKQIKNKSINILEKIKKLNG